jgi:pimeloyl-ACP methyl ester carboxylesterase
MLNWVETGRGPALVLVHGMAASLHDWDALVPALVRAGYRVLAVDLPGHGDSPKSKDLQAYTIPAMYAAFEIWLCNLGLKAPFVLIGHSLGGYVSMEFSLRHPEMVAGVVLVNPLYKAAQLSLPLRIWRRRPNLGMHLLQLVPTRLIQWALESTPVYKQGFSPEARSQIAIDLKRASPNILRLTRQIPDLTPKLEDLRMPALLIWGERDLTLKPGSFPPLAARLPNATSHSISRCGHQAHITRSETVGRLIQEFLFSNLL